MTDRFTERVERLLNRVPGYTGYRNKESMRDDDRRLRQEIARELTQAIDRLTSVSSRLASERQLSKISTIENTIGRVRHLESRVRTATYGYGGLFSDRSVDEFALQQLKQFEVDLRGVVLNYVKPRDLGAEYRMYYSAGYTIPTSSLRQNGNLELTPADRQQISVKEHEQD